MIQTFILISIFWACYFTGLTLGWIIPERLVKPFGLLDLYPFRCRTCCTTWSLVAVYATYLFLHFNWVILGCSIFVTAGTIYGMHVTELERITEYDE